VADFAWLWQGSWLRRLLVFWQRYSVGLESSSEATQSEQAPPRWRLLLYAVGATLAVVFVFVLPQGGSLIKWAVLGILLVHVWVRPQLAVYAVAFLLPFLPILSLTYLLLVAMVAHWLQGQRLASRSSLLRTLAALFCLVALAAAFASPDKLPSLRYWRYYLAGFFLLALLLDTIQTETHLARVVSWGLLAAMVVAGFSVWEYLGGAATNLSWVDIRVAAVRTRVVGTFDNPNMLAAYLVAWLPFAAARIFDKNSTIAVRLTNLFVTGLLGLSLVLTFSRGGWLAAAAALFVVVTLQAPRLLWALPGLILLAPLVLPPIIWQRLLSIVNLEDTSNMVRLYVWDSSFQMFFHNWILGIGQGLVPFARVYPIFQFGVVPALHAHSLILQLAVEGGIFLLLFFLWISLATWRIATTRWEKAPVWAVPSAAALLGQLVHGLFDHTWYDVRLMLAFWLLVGLTLAAYRLRLGETR